MKRDLLIGGVFVLAATAGIATVFYLYGLRPDANAPRTIQPKSEPIARAPAIIVAPAPEVVKRIPIKEVSTSPLPKKLLRKKASPVIAKADPDRPPAAPEGKATPKIEIKRAVPREIVLGNIVKLNDVGGEYVLPVLNSQEKILIGRIKTLKFGGANATAILDASELIADEILVTGDINGEARIRLHAPRGVVEFQREINGRARVEVIAPEGKVVFKSTHASLISGEPGLTIVARDVLLLGDIDGTKTTLNVTLTRDGSLKFHRLLGGARLNYAKADAGDPEPRLEAGTVGPAARIQKIAPSKR